jgi:hypothetical protein
VRLLLCIAAVSALLGAASCRHVGSSAWFVATTNTAPIFSTNGAVIGTNYQVSYAVRPGVTNFLNRADELTRPFPWSGILHAILGTAAGVLGIVAKYKSDQAALVPTLIAGVESADGNQEVKKSIQRIAFLRGLQPRLHRTVQRLTK